MGAEASRDGSALRAPRLSKASLRARWQGRQLPKQLFSVVRHAERADGVFAFVDSSRWSFTEDANLWPLDPPLSDVGLETAFEIGKRLAQSAAELGSTIHVVVSSPYCRCTQTALLICKALGPGVRLLVDRSLGEVYGPSVMGPTKPTCPVRSIDQTIQFGKFKGINCPVRVIGTWPTWPEQLKTAQRRYSLRFLSFLQRSITARRNFVLVTHADGVGAALSMMPSLVERAVEKVEYGGMFLAKRDLPGEKKHSGREVSSQTFIKVLPAPDEDPVVEAACSAGALADFDNLAEAGSLDVVSPPVRQGSWVTGDLSRPSHQTRSQQCQAWEVQLHNIRMRQRHGVKKLRKQLQLLASESNAQLDELLGDLDDRPLSASDELVVKAEPPVGNTVSGKDHTCCSTSSTYLFGVSDISGDGDSRGRGSMASFMGERMGERRSHNRESVGSARPLEEPPQRALSLDPAGVADAKNAQVSIGSTAASSPRPMLGQVQEYGSCHFASEEDDVLVGSLQSTPRPRRPGSFKTPKQTFLEPPSRSNERCQSPERWQSQERRQQLVVCQSIDGSTMLSRRKRLDQS